MKKAPKFEDLFEHEIEDLYRAEKQVAAALPKMIAASSSEELINVLTAHLEESRRQVSRLETVLEQAGLDPDAAESQPMEALIAAGERLIAELEKSPVRDAAVVTAVRKVTHYEIAGYSTASELAETLALQDAHDLLYRTLEEEIETDANLSDIGEAILSGDDPGEEEIEEAIEEVEVEEEES